MKSTILIFMLFISNSILCQSFDELLQKKQFSQAEKHIVEANELDEPIYRLKLGDAYLESNYLEDAERHFFAIMDKSRINKLANRYFERKKLYKALYCFSKSDDYTTGLKLMVEHFIYCKQADSARKYTRLYLEENKIRDVAFHKFVSDIIEIDLNNKNFAKAITFAKDLAYAPTKGKLAESLFEANLLDEAFNFREYAKNNSEFNDNLGDLFYSKKDFEKALECFISSENLTKINECYVMLAKSAIRNDNIDEAKALFEKAFATETMNFELGNYFYTKGKYEEANNYFIKLPASNKYNHLFESMIVQMKAIYNYASAITYMNKLGRHDEGDVILKKILINNDDGTISSTEYPFLWQKDYAGPMKWEDAKKYCDKLSLAGYNDWLLPDNIAFNTTIQKHLISNPNLIQEYFSQIVDKLFWTNTKYGNAENPQQYFAIPVSKEASQQLKNINELLYVKCYRPFNN